MTEHLGSWTQDQGSEGISLLRIDSPADSAPITIRTGAKLMPWPCAACAKVLLALSERAPLRRIPMKRAISDKNENCSLFSKVLQTWLYCCVVSTAFHVSKSMTDFPILLETKEENQRRARSKFTNTTITMDFPVKGKNAIVTGGASGEFMVLNRSNIV